MQEKRVSLPRLIDGGAWDAGHVQGIAVDTERGFVYYSFTTILVKTDLSGRLIGTAGGLVGHLGCIDLNRENGKVYGSLEYKNDAIGKGILRRLGREGEALEDAFYIVCFDVDRITRPGMDAEQDGIMRAVYLPDVVADYNGTGMGGAPHRYGCSGIDGLSFGPVFGAAPGTPWHLTIAYGIYRDPDRADNDHQVLLQYDWRQLEALAEPLSQGRPHHKGLPAEAKYFFYTGNTTYGVQNLCYDPASHLWCASVYAGKKPEFPNYTLYLIDGSAAPTEQELAGLGGERGALLHAADYGERHEASGTRGFYFPWGTTGLHSLGDGRFYISHEGRTPAPQSLYTSQIHLYRTDFGGKVPFLPVEE